MKIAVVGSGISGLSAAYYLSKNHHVDLFEKEDHFGGHSHTIDLIFGTKKVSVDIGQLCDKLDKASVQEEAHIIKITNRVPISVSQFKEIIAPVPLIIPSILCDRTAPKPIFLNSFDLFSSNFIFSTLLTSGFIDSFHEKGPFLLDNI